MTTKEEIINYVKEKENIKEVVKYLSGADLKLEDLEDVLFEIPELKVNGLGGFNASSYDFQVLKRTLDERVKIAEPEISWKSLCTAYKEAGHNVEYFM